ncbi:MAG: peptidase dipeptidase [Acidimicrobiales bacterium]|nr:peptidase dipeptidase [Acidimicrobiales bacterium]
MCDTLVSLTDAGVLFAKNSDRDPNEAQVLRWHPAADHEEGTELRCTWIAVPQVARTAAVVLSQPWWMWGAEMGANEHGVVIGNEAVFTKRPKGGAALLGMDLLRLGLERAATADDAVQVMVELLERHGQGGPCSHEHPDFTYHNSFLVADPQGAVVLETADGHWATEEVRGPGRSISNGLTIAGFAEAHADRLRGRVASCARRRARTEASAARSTTPADLFAALRDHGDDPSPQWSPLNGALDAPCVHAGGKVTSSQTTSSWVADLREAPLHWVTATAAPCTSLFKPVRVDQPVELGPDPTNRFDDDTVWWRHERLHRLALHDHAAATARFTAARQRTEASWLAAPPTTLEAFARAEELEEAWLADLGEAGLPERRPRWLRSRWADLDDAAGITVGLSTPARAPSSCLPPRRGARR